MWRHGVVLILDHNCCSGAFPKDRIACIARRWHMNQPFAYDYIDEFLDAYVDQLEEGMADLAGPRLTTSGRIPPIPGRPRPLSVGALLRRASERLIAAMTSIRGGAGLPDVGQIIYEAERAIRQAAPRVRDGEVARQLHLATRNIALARRETFRSLSQTSRLRGAIWHLQAARRAL